MPQSLWDILGNPNVVANFAREVKEALGLRYLQICLEDNFDYGVSIESYGVTELARKP